MAKSAKKSSQKRSILLVALFVVAVAGICLILQFKRANRKLIKVSSYEFCMNTVVTLNFYVTKSEAKALGDGEDCVYTKELMAIFNDLDDNVLSWRSADSEVAGFNAWESTEPYEVSETLYLAVSQSQELAEATAGAGDITLRALIEAWGIEAYAADHHDKTTSEFGPDTETLENVAEIIGYKHLTCFEKDGKFFLQKDTPKLQLDLGAVGKGYALDAAFNYLKQQDKKKLPSAIVAVGGSVLVYGSRTAKIGVQDPLSEGATQMGILTIDTLGAGDVKYISTSGNYEQYVLVENEDGSVTRYHHILDGETLAPAESGLKSVTVIADNGLTSDMLSTACFVLGMEESLDVLEEYGCDAIFIDENNQVYCTAGVMDDFEITSEEYGEAKLVK